ncbi:MAG: class II fructose-bisphosphatase [Chloroflexi bacterium]|uniref:Fructose-1,6-bisphosphatase n=1 Tax=Candidatus Chlorohelix allophototropha TaxID=3003348 RepID=A0A8T7LW55_9CHLR|nr:class II fructose-bisphosphatase [Chloroflexota bacterium]
MPEKIDRNISLELVRVTEAAAMAAARLMGRGDKNKADGAAVRAMRIALGSISMDGTVVIGEGEKDEAPMLYIGEKIGNGEPPKVDIAVDPIDGTRLLSLGLPNAIAVVALAEAGSLYTSPGIFYMNKIAVGPSAKGAIDLDKPVEWNLKSIAEAKRLPLEELTVVVLDRPRHEQLMREIREAGARIKLITDGDIAGALMTVLEDTGVDVLMGIGGSPEAVVTACALKCIGGEMQCRPYPRHEEDRRKALSMGADLNKLYTIDDLVASDQVFVSITGITNGELVDGVKYSERHIETHSLVMRSKSGTVRDIRARHSLDKLMAYSEVEYLAPSQK